MKLKKSKATIPQQISGIVMAAIASISFGFIPLFSLPLMSMGLRTPSILVYRFLFASILFLPVLFYKRVNMKLNLREALLICCLGMIYILSAMGLQLGYLYMSSGVATVLHFTYPIFVILLLFLFFRERPSWIVQLAILLAFFGVFLISGVANMDRNISFASFLMVIMTGLAYASYMVIVNKSQLSTMNNFKLSFYILLFCGIAFLIIAYFWGGIQVIPNKKALGFSFLLALIPTFLSNIMLVEAVRKCGSSYTSILGALEPLTAVVIGILVFKEEINLQNVLGIALILIAVLMIALFQKGISCSCAEKRIGRKEKK